LDGEEDGANRHQYVGGKLHTVVGTSARAAITSAPTPSAIKSGG
jgi:hypothetical protein